MSPLINLSRPGLDGFQPTLRPNLDPLTPDLRPLTCPSRDERYAARAQHAHDLVHGNVAQTFGENQVDSVVDIRQMPTVERVD